MSQNSQAVPPPPADAPIRIIEPTNEENRYRFRIRVGGLVHNAYLTYELPSQGDKRTILMVKSPQPLINHKSTAEFDRLVRLIREFVGRFAGDKNIVNRLAEKKVSNLPNVRIAVHKFGPVPVYLLPEQYTIKHLAHELTVQIGIYPDVRFQGGTTKDVSLNLPFLATKSEFTRSLDIDLGLMFQRYLEDVGEAMYDIKHHLNLAGVFDRAKEIEDMLAESIKTKLDAATPSPEVFARPVGDDQHFVKGLFERKQDWIFTARYARQYALFFLNELYRHIGLKSRSEDYLKGFWDIQTQFDSLLGAGYMAEARERLNLISILSRTIRAYLQNEKERRYDAIREINVEGEPLWVRRFVQFARFIATLERESLTPTAGRIFISCQHDVPVTEVLKKQITDYVKSQFLNQIEVLSVKETGTGVRYKSRIRARIWVSDTVSELVPKNTEVISGQAVKDYLWLAREAEYGLLLGKRVIYFVEEGINEERVRADLMRKEERGGLIPSTARVPDTLEKELIESFTEYTRAKFSVRTIESDGQDLDPQVRAAIHSEAQDAIERRHEDILIGFHHQFPKAHRRTLKHIQEIVPYPAEATKNALARKLHALHPATYASERDAVKAITKVWKLAEKRSLLINDKPMSLMRLRGRKWYSGNLREILRHLRPDKSADEIKEWERQLLNAIIRKTIIREDEFAMYRALDESESSISDVV